MKGKIRAILITCTVLLVGTAAFLWKMNDMSDSLSTENQTQMAEEKDLLENQKGKVIDSVNTVDINPLYLSGKNKNVITTAFSSIDEVYTVKKSAAVEENITTIKESGTYTPQNPLWGYDIYGTNRNSMYVYFTTTGNCYCKYTISVKDSKIPDFTRIADNSSEKNLTKEHEYALVGFVPGVENFVTLQLYNSNDKLSEKVTFSVTMPRSRVEAKTILATENGRSRTEVSNGLFVVFQDGKKVSYDKKGKSKKYAILLYDNSGVLRGEIPTDRYIGHNFEVIYDTLTYAVSENEIAQVNFLGQVTKVCTLAGYRQSGSFCYDGYGNIYVIASANKKGSSPKSKILRLQLENGAVKQVVDMEDILSPVYKKAVKKAGKKNTDWISLNGVQVTGTNAVLVSSPKLSSLIKVSKIGSLLPKIDYIIADKKLYKDYKSLYKKVLKKVSKEAKDGEATEEPTQTPGVDSILDTNKEKPEPFVSQYGQSDISYKAKGGGKAYISMLNNNYGGRAARSGLSYYCMYYVDQSSKTYSQVTNQKFVQTKKEGSAKKKENGYLYCCSDTCTFAEYDKSGTQIKAFHTGKRPFYVEKNDFKNVWFD